MQLDEAVKQTFVELQAKFIGLRREKDQVMHPRSPLVSTST